MENSYNVEQSNKLRSFLITVMVHAALLLLLLFIYITGPNPPLDKLELGGGGIELNYGVEDAGTGDPTNLNSSSPEKIKETPLVAAAPEEPEEFITGEEESIVLPVEEKKKEKEVVKKKEEVKAPVTKEVVPVQKADPRFTMNKSTEKSGEDKGKAGDPGKKEGTVDGRSLMGTPGKGGGSGGGTGTGVGPNLGGGLAGWRFLKQPKVNDQTSEKGTLTFKILVNEDGVIENATVTGNLGGITPTLQLKYKNALIGSELESITGATLTSPISGTVVWEISAK